MTQSFTEDRCNEQEESLSLVFTVASSFGAFSTIITGAILDYSGI